MTAFASIIAYFIFVHVMTITCKHPQCINLHLKGSTSHLLEATERGPLEKRNHWVHYTDNVMTFFSK